MKAFEVKVATDALVPCQVYIQHPDQKWVLMIRSDGEAFFGRKSDSDVGTLIVASSLPDNSLEIIPRKPSE